MADLNYPDHFYADAQKPTGAYGSRKLYDETSAIALAQDAKLDLTPADRDAKLRTAAQYIYHAKLLMDEALGTSTPAANESQSVGLDLGRPAKWSPEWLGVNAVPVENSYLSSFGPNNVQAEVLRESGIGDVTPQHSMAAEAIRDHDERLFGGEDRL